ncbi:MAG: hypothetical protein H6Q17_2343 [Bacteroidetes bacterium]|nr:hypothetical protein [Bacteroidota bacterium]
MVNDKGNQVNSRSEMCTVFAPVECFFSAMDGFFCLFYRPVPIQKACLFGIDLKRFENYRSETCLALKKGRLPDKRCGLPNFIRTKINSILPLRVYKPTGQGDSDSGRRRQLLRMGHSQ